MVDPRDSADPRPPEDGATRPSIGPLPEIEDKSREDRANGFRSVFGYLATWRLIGDSVANRWFAFYASRGFTDADLGRLQDSYGLRPDWTPGSGFPFGLRREAWPADWRSR